MTVNLAGGTAAGLELDSATASRWLFAFVATAPFFCLVMLRRLYGEIIKVG